jgi:hypothetical protein
MLIVALPYTRIYPLRTICDMQYALIRMFFLSFSGSIWLVAFGWQHHLISSDGLTTISLQTCVVLYISYMARDRSFLSDIHNSELTMYDDHECQEVL